MAQEVTLTASLRANLVSLQQTATLLGSTQERLSTGKRVNSPLDNPVNYFTAAAHTARANDLSSRKEGLGEVVQTIKAANSGIEGLKSLIENAKAVVETARSTTQTGLKDLYKQFNEIQKQIRTLITDSGYKGTNFLKGTSVTLDALFNETGTNKLTITGFNGKISGLLSKNNAGSNAIVAGKYSALAANVTKISAFGAAGGAAGFSLASNLNAAAAGLTAAISVLSVKSSQLSSNLSVINTRLDFTSSLVNTLKEGADKLTLADTNEEGAKLLALQTRQQLGVTSLSLASQAAQSVLRLF